MNRIKAWWNAGGNNLIGIDDAGEKMWSITNGTAVLIWTAVIVPTVFVVGGFIWMAWRFG